MSNDTTSTASGIRATVDQVLREASGFVVLPYDYAQVVEKAIAALEERESEIAVRITDEASERFGAERIEVLIALGDIGMVITTPEDPQPEGLNEAQKTEIRSLIDQFVDDVKSRFGI